jgi:hypothetical protein
MRYANSLTWLAVAPVVFGACALGVNRSTGVQQSPDAAAVQDCVSLIALSEGYEFSARTRAIGAPSGNSNWRERLELKVRLTGDSALPNARIRTATTAGGRSSAHVSATGNRILSRVNRECRIARGL